jgi:hypothetical protein
MDTAPAFGRDAAGSPTPAVPVSNANTGVTPPSQPDSTKDAGTTPEESVGRVAEEQIREAILELKGGRPEDGIMGWLSAAILFLLGLVVLYLFIRWRNTGRGTVAVPLPEIKAEGAGDPPLELAIGSGGEAVR